MNIATEIAEMERGLATAGRTIKALCDEAGINQSTWTRWKSESHSPTMTTWGQVVAAYGRLTPQTEASAT